MNEELTEEDKEIILRIEQAVVNLEKVLTRMDNLICTISECNTDDPQSLEEVLNKIKEYNEQNKERTTG